MEKQNPTWYQDAIDQKIDFIVFIYNRIEGFAFCPSNLEKPFHCGGDDLAHGFVTPEIAFNIYNYDMSRELRDRIFWFAKYIEMVYLEEDFSLKELDLENRDVRVISGKWPW
jgi:hypothetical protein